jgi:peptide/nickel transport system substrate-binding protein
MVIETLQARSINRSEATLGQQRKQPRSGGTLRLVGPGGPDHLDTASAYYATSGQILRALTRQLFTYAATSDLSDPERTFAPVPDMAQELPTEANGGLSADHCVYTIHLRPGVMWDTSPKRQVTAGDIIRGVKRLGNPIIGCGARAYFTSTIDGMMDYCNAYDRAFIGKQPSLLVSRITSTLRV